jgi:hypothetical protein
MMPSNQEHERGRPEEDRVAGYGALGTQLERAGEVAETPQRKFQNLLHATREASQLRRANKRNRIDPFQTLVYECLPDDGAPLPFFHLCLLVTERLHHRFPTKSEKVTISKAVGYLESRGMVKSERMSTKELKKRGYNLSGFYCKMIWKNPHNRCNGTRSVPNNLV